MMNVNRTVNGISCVLQTLLVFFIGLPLLAAPSYAPYLSVDIRSWKTIRFYDSITEVPGGKEDARYKTTHLLLRKVPKKDWYVALQAVTPELSACVDARLEESQAQIIAKLRAVTGLPFEEPTKAFPQFKTFNPVLSAKATQQALVRSAANKKGNAKALTWFSSKSGIALEGTFQPGAQVTDMDQLAKSIASLHPSWVCIGTGLGRENTFKLVGALGQVSIPVMLRISARPGAANVPFADEAVGARAKTIADWSSRLGGGVAAWLFVDATPVDGFTDDISAEYAKAARTGNSEALVSFSPTKSCLRKCTPSCDFTAGEIEEPLSYACRGMSVDGAQWHAFVSASVRARQVKVDKFSAWVKNVLAAKGALTFGIGFDAGSLTTQDAEAYALLSRRARKTSARATSAEAAEHTAGIGSKVGRVVRVNSKTGDDENGDGTALRPYKTPRRAADAVNDLIYSRGLPKGGVVIEVNGRYNYPKGPGFSLGSSDSGQLNNPIVWTAGEEGAVFSGAYHLSPNAFKPVTDPAVLKRFRNKDIAKKVRVFDLKEIGIEPFDSLAAAFLAWDGFEVFASGKPQMLARYPDRGWLEIAEVVDGGTQERITRAEGWKGPPSLSIVRPGTIGWGRDPEPERWNVSKGVYLFGYWCWDWAMETLRVASIDTAKHQLTFEGIHAFGIGSCVGLKQPRRYYAYNMLEVLDAPGEWYIDRDERLLYYLPGPDGLKDVELATQGKYPLVELNSTQNVIIRGFKFEHSLCSAFVMRDCSHVTADGLEITWMSRGAASISGGSDNVMTNCIIGWTGDGGVSVHGGNRYSLKPCNNRVTGCELHHAGRLTRHGSCLTISGVGVQVDHNYIHDTPYIALNYTGNDHVIEYNEIACAMMEGSDGGATYTGRDWGSQGNVLRYNYIHHLGAEGLAWLKSRGIDSDCEAVKESVMVNGVYLDDCDSGDIVTNNVFYKAGLALMVGGGHDNKIRNNFVLDCDVAMHLDTRGAEWSSFDYSEEASSKNSAAMLVHVMEYNYKEPPWSERYPALAKIMEGDPRLPLGTEFSGNVCFGCRQMMSAGKLALETIHGKLNCTGNRFFGKPSGSDVRGFPQNEKKMKDAFFFGNANKKIESQEPGMALSSSTFKTLCPDFPPIDFASIGKPNAGKNKLGK